MYTFSAEHCKSSQVNSDFDVTLDVGNCNVDNVLSSGMKTSAPSVTTNICILGTFQTQIRNTEKDSENQNCLLKELFIFRFSSPSWKMKSSL